MDFKSIHTIKFFAAHLTGEDTRPSAFPFVAGQTLTVQECFATTAALVWCAVIHLTGTSSRARGDLHREIQDTFSET